MAAAASASARRIVVSRRLPAAVLDRLRGGGAAGSSVVDVWDSDEAMPRATLLERVAGASALVCTLADRVDAELLAAATPSLRAIATMSVGVSHIDVAAAVAAGVRIGYTPDVLTAATADLVLALALATARRVPEAAAAVRSGEWSSWKPFWMCGKSVAGTTVGVIGAGRIGAAVARRFRGFDCKLRYWGRSGPKADFFYADAGHFDGVQDIRLARFAALRLVGLRGKFKCGPDGRTVFFVERRFDRFQQVAVSPLNQSPVVVFSGNSQLFAYRSFFLRQDGQNIIPFFCCL